MTIAELIERLKVELGRHGNIEVAIAGADITNIEVVPAEDIYPAYLDIVGA